MAVHYLINGENGDISMEENSDKKLQKELRGRQTFNYLVATIVQIWLGFSVVGNFFTSQVALWSDPADMDKWFSRSSLSLICLGFIGVISAVKTLFKHEANDWEDETKSSDETTPTRTASGFD